MPAHQNDNRLRTHAGRHHARYIEKDVPMHVISRVFQGRHLLTPCPELNSLIVGVIGHALGLFASIELYALAVLSNHAHFMLSGEPNHVSGFVGFVKREISRRWGGRQHINWPGAMWEESLFTALPTAQSQEQCLQYILSHGVKENLVEHPLEWPGVHCAQTLLSGVPLQGRWLNATAFGRDVRAQKRKIRAPRVVVVRSDYEDKHVVDLRPIPVWRGLTEQERYARVAQMVARIVDEARLARSDRPVLGAAMVERVSRGRRTTVAPPPWFTERRCMICWANPREAQTRAYLARYWRFQQEYRKASDMLLKGDNEATFPPGAFRPPTYVYHRNGNAV